jgi:hypothetical protein
MWGEGRRITLATIVYSLRTVGRSGALSVAVEYQCGDIYCCVPAI